MISANKQAKLLLTCALGTRNSSAAKPFTINEYAYFAVWLKQQNSKPSDLLDTQTLEKILNQWLDCETHEIARKHIKLHGLQKTIQSISVERIQQLLARGLSLSLALEKWCAAGIWILDREDYEYPVSIKKHLKHQSPALLFGIGNKNILNNKGIGFVGSRNIEKIDLDATVAYVRQANELGFQVISGGARGVDESAMIAALDNGGTAVGILPGDLLKSGASSQWRPHLRSEKLLLISVSEPESRFSPAAAMARNKYIYLLADSTIVIRSDEKGGTWEGATENLKKGWAPIYISAHRQPNYIGNSKLIKGFKTQVFNAHQINLIDAKSVFKVLSDTEQQEPLNVEERSPDAHQNTEQLGFGFDGE